MVISQNSLSNMTTNCANCDYSAISGSKVIHNVEGVKINFTQLFYEHFNSFIAHVLPQTLTVVD